MERARISLPVPRLGGTTTSIRRRLLPSSYRPKLVVRVGELLTVEAVRQVAGVLARVASTRAFLPSASTLALTATASAAASIIFLREKCSDRQQEQQQCELHGAHLSVGGVSVKKALLRYCLLNFNVHRRRLPYHFYTVGGILSSIFRTSLVEVACINLSRSSLAPSNPRI